jgi:hypothetical protein
MRYKQNKLYSFSCALSTKKSQFLSRFIVRFSLFVYHSDIRAILFELAARAAARCRLLFPPNRGIIVVVCIPI